MDFSAFITEIGEYLWSWPSLALFVLVGIYLTISLRFIQFRTFFRSWKLIFAPGESKKGKDADMTPLQAFVNVLGTSTGNGSLAGIATAIASGGPGAAFWVFAIGFISMIFRFGEVYLSTYYRDEKPFRGMTGGPMVYLRKVPGGSVLPFIFALFCMFYGFTSGNMMQCNSIGLSLEKTWGVPLIVAAFVLLAFVIYVVAGGAKRVVTISDKLVPSKVAVFFIAAISLLVFHYASILPAIWLILRSAFTGTALIGGAVGYTIQQAIRFGISRTLNANEAGLGTAAVFFGSTGSENSMNDGILGMLGTFISTQIVSFLVALCIITSGVWNSGLTSTPLTIAAFETVFGSYGGWIVSFCSIAFGIGVMVSYSYAARECWLFLTNGKYITTFLVVFSSISFIGTITRVDIVWGLSDIVNAVMVAINLFGLVWLLRDIKRGVKNYFRK